MVTFSEVVDAGYAIARAIVGPSRAAHRNTDFRSIRARLLLKRLEVGSRCWWSISPPIPDSREAGTWETSVTSAASPS